MRWKRKLRKHIAFPVRDFIKDGPVQYPKGPTEGEAVLIKYDDAEGALPDGSPKCALAWGVDGWTLPDLIPPGTIRISDWVETRMERGLEQYRMREEITRPTAYTGIKSYMFGANKKLKKQVGKLRREGIALADYLIGQARDYPHEVFSQGSGLIN